MSLSSSQASPAQSTPVSQSSETQTEDALTETGQSTESFSSSGPLPPVADGGDGGTGPSASELAFGESTDSSAAMESAELEGQSNTSLTTEPVPGPGGEKTKQPDKEEDKQQAIKVPLTDETRAAIRVAYSAWQKTGNAPSLLDVREKLSLDWIQVAGPMDRARARMLYDQFSITEGAESLFPKLFREGLPGGKTRPATREPISSIRVRSSAAVYKALRVAREEKKAESGGGPRLETGASAESLTWIWNLLKGDFNEDPDTAQTVINGVAGLIPGLDQLLDARDVTANLYDLVYEGRYNEAGPWFGFVTTLIGAVPELGSILKTVARVGAKGVGDLGKPLLRAILEWADSPRLASWVMQEAQGAFKSVMTNLETVLATAGAVSSAARAWVTKLLDNARAALAQLAKRAEAALQQVKTRIDELLASLRKADDEIDEVVPNAPKARPETPKAERVEANTPKTEAPKNEAPKNEAPKNEAPKNEAPKTEAPKTERTDTETSRTKEPASKPELDERFKYEDGIRVRDKDSGFWLDRDGFLVDKEGRRVNRDGQLLGADNKPLADQPSTAALTPRQKFEKKFAQVYGETAVAYRGIRLEPGAKVNGLAKGPLGDGQMVSFDVDTALHYAMTPGGAFDAAASEIVIVRIQVKAEHLTPMYDGDLNHVFVKPDVDITALPGYDVIRMPKPDKIEELSPNKLTKQFDQRATP